MIRTFERPRTRSADSDRSVGGGFVVVAPLNRAGSAGPHCSAESPLARPSPPLALGCPQPFLLEATLTECDCKCAERNHHLESETSLM